MNRTLMSHQDTFEKKKTKKKIAYGTTDPANPFSLSDDLVQICITSLKNKRGPSIYTFRNLSAAAKGLKCLLSPLLNQRLSCILGPESTGACRNKLNWRLRIEPATLLLGGDGADCCTAVLQIYFYPRCN